MECVFQSTLPMRGATLMEKHKMRPISISIHAPHAGSDSITRTAKSKSINFNPRSPCGERPMDELKKLCGEAGFQSTLPMRGATIVPDPVCTSCSISIHAPHAGSDDVSSKTTYKEWLFQSTLPMRGATCCSCYLRHKRYFNPRSPCGERLKDYGFH